MIPTARFRYKAMTASGGMVSGVTDAVSVAAVVEWLRGQGHFPLQAEEQTEKSWSAWLPSGLRLSRQPSNEDLAFACQSLALLLHAGLGVERSLDILVGLGEMRRLRPMLLTILGRLRGGGSFADALAGEQRLPRLLVSMVRAGELSGRLEATLSRLADHLTKASALKQAVVSALIYPAILLVTGAVSVTIILVFVLPEFAPLFESAGKEMPLSTRMVMAVGDAVGHYGWAVGLAMMGAALALHAALRRAEPRRRWDRLMLRLPILGTLLIELEMERFARTLGTLTGSGIALPTALVITRDALGNSAVAQAVSDTATSLREGQGLADRLAETGIFPALALDLIRVGEETSRLEEMLLHQADLAERSARLRIDRLLALLVPAITLVFGGIVAVIITSLSVALLGINDLAAG